MNKKKFSKRCWVELLHTFDDWADHRGFKHHYDSYEIVGVYHAWPHRDSERQKYFGLAEIAYNGRLEISGGAWLFPRGEYHEDVIVTHGLDPLYNEKWRSCKIITMPKDYKNGDPAFDELEGRAIARAFCV